LRLPATVWSIFGLHRQSTFQPRLPINLRLSSAIHLPALPSNSTANSHRPSDPPAWLRISLQLAPSTNPTAHLPANLRLASTDQPSSSAFASTCDLRRLPILWPCLPTNLQLAPSINLPASPSCRRSTRVSGQLSSSAFKPNLRLSSAAAFSSCLRTVLRLAPPTDPPASPSCQSSAFAFDQPSGCTFQLASDFRRLPTFQPHLRTQPPTLIGCLILQLPQWPLSSFRWCLVPLAAPAQ
jgi:hypothetical protein